MKRYSKLLLPLVFIGSLSGCVVHVGAEQLEHDIDGVFGDIDVRDGQQKGNLSLVNGNITLGNTSEARNIDTVNGSVHLGDSVKVRNASTVNGNIEAGTGLQARDLSTVNGNIELQSGAMVSRNIATVNGDIIVQGIKVEGDITTVNGDMRISGTSVIQGDIRFEENNSYGFWNDGNDHKPTLTLAADVTINGYIVLEREVELELATEAQRERVVYNYDAE